MVETADEKFLKKVLELAENYEEEKGTDWWDTISDEERKAYPNFPLDLAEIVKT